MTKTSYQTKLINNKLCICKGRLSQKIKFGKLPIINDYKRKINLKKYPVVITQCKKCYLIQLKYSIQDRLLFPNNYSYLSGNSKEKIENFKSIIKKINKISKKKDIKILDIGSNDGSFLKLAKKKYSRVLGIEPTNCAKLCDDKKIQVIKNSLNLKLAKKIKNQYLGFDFITAINILAHTSSLDEILKSIKLLLNKDGTIIIEVQYLYDLITQKGFDSFHHEHNFYFTLSSIQQLFNNYNLYIFDAEKINVHGGILRIYVSQTKKILSKVKTKLNGPKTKFLSPYTPKDFTIPTSLVKI